MKIQDYPRTLDGSHTGSARGCNTSTHGTTANNGSWKVQLNNFNQLKTYPKVRKAVKHNMIHTIWKDNLNQLCQDFTGMFGTSKSAYIVSVFDLITIINKFFKNFFKAAAAVIGVNVRGSNVCGHTNG